MFLMRVFHRSSVVQHSSKKENMPSNLFVKRAPRVLTAISIALLGASALSQQAVAQAPRLMAPPVSVDGTFSVADVVERVSPAVVSIVVEKDDEAGGPAAINPFEEFFRRQYGAPDRGRRPDFDDGFRDIPERRGQLGSGFFIDREGHVVTNHHVIFGGDEITVHLSNGEERKAKLVGSDPLTDIAVLKVEGKDLPAPVEFADQVNLRVGDFAIAVGNPLGFSGSVSFGIVSSIGGHTVGRARRESQWFDFIQIDAAINQGNSGGPTFDLKGRVIGVNTQIATPNGGNVGIGFAVPAKVAKATAQQLIKHGTVTRGWLGVTLQEVTTEIAAALGLEKRTGVLISDVMDETPAAKAGLEGGDVILRLNGVEIDGSADLSRRVAGYAPGSKVTIDVLRNEKERSFNVTLGEREMNPAQGDMAPSEDSEVDVVDELGFRARGLNDQLRAEYDVPDGVGGVVVTGVRPGTAAAAAQLRSGVVILEIEDQKVSSMNDVRNVIDKAAAKGDEYLKLRLQFRGANSIGALSLKEYLEDSKAR